LFFLCYIALVTPSHPRKLVLASSSPRRQELLRNLGLRFEVDPANIDETVPPDATAEDIVRELALSKARVVAARHNDALVIGADSVVELDGSALGKPADAVEAGDMLSALSGRTHRVVSGVAVVDASNGREEVEFDATFVTFRELSAPEIDAYVATGEPQDKAGGYGEQGLGATFVVRLEGDFFTVVGLPIQKLDELLRRFGPGLVERHLADRATE
jgi:septum formation protein